MENLRNVKLEIDGMMTDDVNYIARSFLSTEINFAGLDICYDKATEQMQGTDDYELRKLFEDGVKLGVYLYANRKSISHI